jgi:sodium/hydrogen antiporter
MGWALAIVALALIGVAAVSGKIGGTSLTPAMLFVGIGLLAGKQGLDLVVPSPASAMVRQLAEATLAFVLFTDASRIDLRALRREYAVPARLLGLGLPLTIALGALLAAALFGALSFPEAVVLAIVLAPTDAALGQAVVTESRLPSRIRQGLNVESGLNDGICVPLLLIALAFAEEDAGRVSATHAARLAFEEIGYGIGAGVLAGALAAGVVVQGTRRGLIEPAWLQIVPAAGAVFAYAVATPLGGSGFIAAFVAGIVFAALRKHEGGEVTYLVDELGGLLNGITLVVFGAVLLSPTLRHLDWRIAVYAVASLTLVRMAPVAVAMLGTGARPRTVAFLGWFGPRGLASIVFALLVVDEANLPHTQTIVLSAYATVGLSVLAHGVTAAPLARRYAAWFVANPRDQRPAMESVPAEAQRWRAPPGKGV